MKIAIAQIEVKPAKIQENIKVIIENIDKAKEMGAELVVFPELCITGASIGDRFNDAYFCEEAYACNEIIKNHSQGIGVIWGNIHYGSFNYVPYGRDGRELRLNAAYFAYNGEYVKRSGVYSDFYVKCLNSDYRMFDESRYFLSAIELQSYDVSLNDNLVPFEFNGKKIGLEVSEDLWSDNYALDVTSHYAEANCDYIVNISTSLWIRGKEELRNRCISEYAEKMKLPQIVYCNSVGCQNNGKNVMVIDGGSTIYDTDGQPLFELNDSFESELKLFTGEKSLVKHSETKLLNALVYGIKKFDEQLFPFKPKWIIGLSGGLDSSVNAALLAKALGSDRVIGYNLATKYNSDTTKSNARKLAEALGIEHRDGYISPLVESTLDVMHTYGYEDKDISTLTEENIQARIRGHVLSTFAAINNGVVCNNGNKVEAALGYLTLYGDSIGALCPIGDLLKTDLFELSLQLNKDKEVIPWSLLPTINGDKIEWEMPPSAELKNNQVDPMKWYYHDYIIQYLCEYPNYGIENLVEMYCKDKLASHKYLSKWVSYYHLDNPEEFFKDIEWVVGMMNRNAYKRIQLPPNIIVSKGAFGNDLRESQILVPFSKRYLELKNECLQSKKD